MKEVPIKKYKKMFLVYFVVTNDLIHKQKHCNHHKVSVNK